MVWFTVCAVRQIYNDQRVNLPKEYIDAVRARKGLACDRKIVVHAEKQRTIARKK